MLRLYSEFCGVGGDTWGATRVRWVRNVLAANHWQIAIDSHAANFPDAEHYCGDVRSADIGKFPYAEIFWASPACFPAGTLILTRRGLIPIEQVEVGDEAFTHLRRWRPVVDTMRRQAPTVRVHGVGVAAGVETTAEHPFYTRTRSRVWDQPTRRWRRNVLSYQARWTPANELTGMHMWATPIDFGEPVTPPAVPGRGIEFTDSFWWMIGRWLGDGWLRAKPRGELLSPVPRRRSQPSGSPCLVCGKPARSHHKSTSGRVSPYCSDECKRTMKRKNPDHGRYDLSIVCGHHETDQLSDRLQAMVELRWQYRRNRTAGVFTTSHRGLVEWVSEHFGHGATGKTIPAWALAMPEPWRKALLDGYLSADGAAGHYTEAATVSKRLAVGVRMLANTLGCVANLKGPYQRKGRTIEGRAVVERPTWTVNWITGGPQHAYHRDDDGYRWAPVKKIESTGATTEVFNIAVADDESYLADGIVVHNCPPWTDARGKRRDFDQQTMQQPSLFGDEPSPDESTKRARLLMEEVPRYLQAMDLRGKPVLVGVVENVVQCRLWADWGRWVKEIEAVGYKTRLIAFNSMHAAAPISPRAPQSRDRLYLAYWHKSLGRDPDWDKWLRPAATCGRCGERVAAVQAWKKPGNDMGRYRSQYLYLSPHRSCGGQPVEPDVVPALAAIDPTLPGVAIKDRPANDPLQPATLDRIRAGIRRYWLPLLTPAGGTWRDEAVPLDVPMPTRTTRETDGLAVPPLLVPVESRPGKVARPATDPARTQTARNETAVTELPLPFVTPLRGGGDRGRAYPVTSTLGTVSAQGNHHGLALPPLVMRNFTARGDQGQMTTPASEPLRTLNATGKQSLLSWADQLLVPYYGAADSARPARGQLGALTARDRYGLAQPGEFQLAEVDVEELLHEVRFRMLAPHEIAAAMAFDPTYRVLAKSKRDKVRLYGNAVTPPVAEIIVSALVEAITGEPLEPAS